MVLDGDYHRVIGEVEGIVLGRGEGEGEGDSVIIASL